LKFIFPDTCHGAACTISATPAKIDGLSPGVGASDPSEPKRGPEAGILDVPLRTDAAVKCASDKTYDVRKKSCVITATA
jgi:hypothetical protein